MDKDDLESLAVALLRELCVRDIAVATSESCTGGLIASLLTDVEGMSHAFERGFVVYTDAAKTSMLGVPTSLIEEAGAVSAPVAEAMARGAIAHSRARAAMAVTGYAGPAREGEEAGLVYVAAAFDDVVRVRELRLGNVGRKEVRNGAALALMALLRELLVQYGHSSSQPGER